MSLLVFTYPLGALWWSTWNLYAYRSCWPTGEEIVLGSLIGRALTWTVQVVGLIPTGGKSILSLKWMYHDIYINYNKYRGLRGRIWQYTQMAEGWVNKVKITLKINPRVTAQARSMELHGKWKHIEVKTIGTCEVGSAKTVTEDSRQNPMKPNKCSKCQTLYVCSICSIPGY